MSESELSITGPGNDRPVRGQVGVSEVPLGLNGEGLSSRHLDGCGIVGTILEGSHEGVSWDIEARPEGVGLTLVGDATAIPSVASHIDSLVNR